MKPFRNVPSVVTYEAFVQNERIRSSSVDLLHLSAPSSFIKPPEQFKLKSDICLEEARKPREHQSGQPVCAPRFEAETSEEDLDG
jgi:hypothetical protein